MRDHGRRRMAFEETSKARDKSPFDSGSLVESHQRHAAVPEASPFALERGRLSFEADDRVGPGKLTRQLQDENFQPPWRHALHDMKNVVAHCSR